MGFILFPAWFGLLAAVVGILVGSTAAGFLVFFVLFLSGISVNWYLNTVMLYFLKKFWPGRRTPLDVLRAMRRDLISELEQFRKLSGEENE